MEIPISRPKRSAVKRKAVSTTLGENMVAASPMFEDSQVLLQITPTMSGLALHEWIKRNQDMLIGKVHKHGAILLRGFGLETDADFLEVTGALPLERIDASIFEESNCKHRAWCSNKDLHHASEVERWDFHMKSSIQLS